MKKIELEDLCRVKGASMLTFSPDGNAAAFTVTVPDLEQNCYDKNIWIWKSSEAEARQLTAGNKDTEFCFDDNDTLLMLSGRGSEDDKKSSFYRISLNGGEAVKVFELDKKAQWIKPLRHGLYCIGILTDRNEEDEKDYHVIDEIPLWANGKGFVSGQRTAVFVYDEEKKTLEKLSPDNMDVKGIDILNGKVLCLGKEWEKLITETDSLILYDIEKKTETKIISQGSLDISNACFVDEDTIMLTASDHKRYGTGQYHDIYSYDLAEESLKRAAETGRFLGMDFLTDSSYGTGKYFCVGHGRVSMIGQDGSENGIYDLENGRLVKKISCGGMISCMDISDTGIIYAGMTKDGCCEVYLEQDGETRRLTHLNDIFMKEYTIAPVKPFDFVNSDGIAVEGFVIEPADYNPSEKYPAILEIHGGPRCAYGKMFYHEMQVMAARGYFVFFCNPRGSEGYGEEFADLRGKYGTVDYQDLMEFTDAVLAAYPQIDSTRLGASGGSYGGFMCNWIEGHTDRFAAIASQRSVSNWVSDFGTSEIGVSFDINEMKNDPWNGMNRMWECSPLAYADRAKTPILFIHSMCDYNCTLDQGVQMFTAMQYFGVPSRMCLFEGENHSLSRSGKPKHRVRRLKEIMGWFDKYLMNREEEKN